MEENRSEIDFSYNSSGITHLDSIDQQRRIFSQLKSELFSKYLEKERQIEERRSRILSFNGWSNRSTRIGLYHQDREIPYKNVEQIFQSDEGIERSGGFWVSLGKNGIALNPGNHFLDRFHKEGLHIWDIDHIIITDADEKSSSELLKIWKCNREINQMLHSWGMQPHIIHYWLHPDAFDRYGSFLRPIYREEQNSIHRLDLFENVTLPEKIELSSNIELSYMAHPAKKSSYAIRLEEKIKQNETDSPLAIAFFLQTPWTDLFTSLIDSVQIAVMGIGFIDFESITTLSATEKTLGYRGVIELIAHAHAIRGEKRPLFLVSEYAMNEGDFRIEAIKQLKMDIIRTIYEREGSYIQEKELYLLPSEESLSFSLPDLLLEKGPGLRSSTHIENLCVVRSNGPFSKLSYLSKEEVLYFF